jgi:hypothetical protein
MDEKLTNRQKSLKNGDKYYEGKLCKKCLTTKKRTPNRVCDQCEKNRAKTNHFKFQNYNNQLKRRYGIDFDDVQLILENQDYRCKICKTDIGIDTQSRKKFNIDHCHKTGIVRGALCNLCNLSLGGFGDSVINLKAAIEYLNNNLEMEIEK